MRIVAFDFVNRIVHFSPEPGIGVRGKPIVFLVVCTSTPRVFFFFFLFFFVFLFLFVVCAFISVRIFHHPTPFRLRPILAFLFFRFRDAPRFSPRTRAIDDVLFVKLARHCQRFHLVFQNFFYEFRFRPRWRNAVPSRHRLQLFLDF